MADTGGAARDQLTPLLGDAADPFRRIIEAAAAGVWVVDATGRAVYANARLGEQLGLPVAELIGRTSFEFVHPEDLPAAEGWARRILAGERDVGRFRLRRADGAAAWARFATSALMDPEGRPVGAVGVVVDEPAPDAGPTAPSEEATRLEAILSVAPIAATVQDAALRYTWIFGSTLRDASAGLGKTDADLLPAGEAAGLTALKREVMETGRPATREIRSTVHGVTRHWDLSVQPLHDGAGRVAGVLSVAIEVTARRQAEERLRRSEAELGALLEVAPIGILVTRAGRVVSANARAAEIYGRPSAEDLVGTDTSASFSPDDAAMLADVARRLRAGEQVDPVLATLHRPDGTSVLVEFVGQAVEPGHPDSTLVSFHQDVTDRVVADRATRESEELFRGVFESAPIGMVLAEVAPGRFGRIVRVNEAMCAIVGRDRETLTRLGIADITHPDDADADRRALRRLVTGESRHVHRQKRYIHGDGHPVWVELSGTIIRDRDGTPLYALGQVQDVTQRRRLERQLRHVAEHDFLTDLLNRRRFERELVRALRAQGRNGEPLALLLLDLDQFKYVNDAFGHTAGDAVIREVGALLAARVRVTDVVARLGGDEFAVLLPGTDEAGARTAAAGIADAVRATPLIIAGQEVRLAASVGVVLIPPDDPRSADELLADADAAMYEAKGRGGDRIAVADERGVLTRQVVRTRHDWAQRLRRALDTGGFELHAQPIVLLESGQPVGHELLLRKRSESGRLIWPAEFLPYAERLGMIGQIDRMVLDRATVLAARIAAAGERHTLHVNLSARSIGDPEVVALLERLLAERGIPEGALVVEITETTALANLAESVHTAERMRAAGAGLALDDFGSGFGSLTSLKSLPFDCLKIDGGFVRDLRLNATDQAVVRAAVDIARTMGMRTVAEHVPDAWTVGFLREAGVDAGQGFYLGVPRAAEDWLREMGIG